MGRAGGEKRRPVLSYCADLRGPRGRGKTRVRGRRLSRKARGSGLRWSGPDAGKGGSGVLGRAGPTEEERADRAGATRAGAWEGKGGKGWAATGLGWV